MFRQILVPLDGSIACIEALEQAVQIAISSRAVVTALCTIDSRVLHEAHIYLPMRDVVLVGDSGVSPSTITLTYQAWAEQLTAQAKVLGAAVGVEIRSEIIIGLPYHEIITRSTSYDLLVLSARQTGGSYPGPFLAGSTLRTVIAQTHLPVLCVLAHAPKLQTLLVAYDGSREAQDALQLAATWCQAQSLTLVVLTVQQTGQQAQSLLRQARLRVQPVIPRLVARDGDPVLAISNIARQYDCDLIFLGVRTHHSLRGYTLGRIASTLFRAGSPPLLFSH